MNLFRVGRDLVEQVCNTTRFSVTVKNRVQRCASVWGENLNSRYIISVLTELAEGARMALSSVSLQNAECIQTVTVLYI